MRRTGSRWALLAIRAARACALAVLFGLAEVSGQAGQSGLAGVSLQATEPSLAQLDLAGAEALLHRGQFAEAESALRAYLLGHAGSAQATYDLGKVLQMQNRPTESLASFTAAAALRPPTADELRVVALNYVLLKDYVDARQWLERAAKMDPGSAEIWYDLGRTHMMQLSFQDAEVALKRSLALAPKSVKAENNLGLTYEAENRNAEAQAAYRTAMEWQKDLAHPSEQPFLNSGKLLIEQNQSREATPLLERAVALAPGDAKCHEQLARALDREGAEGTVRAEQEMALAVQLNPSNARLHFQLGQMYRRSGKTALAKEQLDLSNKLYGTTSSDR